MARLRYDLLFDYLMEQGLQPELVEDDEEITICCPMCEDDRPRLYISAEHGGWVCFHCSEEGNLHQFLMEACGLSGGKAYALETTLLPRDEGNIWGEDWTPTARPEKKREVTTELRLPRQFEPLVNSAEGAANHRDGWRYVLSRRVDPDVAVTLGIGYAKSGRYANRVIIPVTQGGKLYTFIARTLLTQCPNCTQLIDDCTCRPYKYPKVLTPSNMDGAQARGTLFNRDMVGDAKEVTIVEGVFDALRRPHNTVALLGAGHSKAQVSQLLDMARHGTRLTIALDPDTAGYKGAFKLASALAAEMVPVRVALLPDGKDPGSMDDDEWAACLNAAKEFRI